jgi:hypothetical protein
LAEVFDKTHLQVLQLNKKKMDDVTMIQHMTGCSREEAEKALVDHETVLDAIEALMPANPVASGAKYIPAKPTVNHGMDEEQAALCARGRWLQDKVNAVFSVAHSKTLDQPPPESAPQTSHAVVDLETAPATDAVKPESEQGAHV